MGILDSELVSGSWVGRSWVLPEGEDAQWWFPFYLSETQKATLYVPPSMTRKECDLLRQQIENSLTVIEATILTDDPADEA